uniref:Protein-glutamine gamma-glutamyltransferase 2 n=1 Tax=Hucho hucho TaxID=62062 RepID=A0A4W5P770_9TELE
MTHNSGDSGLCFEIWFRRRKSQDTYTLQAGSREVKDAWTKDLERILWEQAVHNRALDIAQWDLECEFNNTDHRTELNGVERLIVRRGQPFTINLHLRSGVYQPGGSALNLTVETGPQPSDQYGTQASFGLTDQIDTSRWSAAVTSPPGNMVSLSICSPPDAPIGRWRLTLGQVGRVDFVLLYNPWCTGDVVYMDSEDKLREYILAQDGIIYRGGWKYPIPTPWNYGQFEDGILNVCLRILDMNPKCLRNPGKDASGRRNPIYVSRVLSAMVNCNDDKGLLLGRWTDDYDGGVSPLSWKGSVEILRNWDTNACQPVRFGQCWVFAAVACSVSRALGIPCRLVTNYNSAHDTNSNLVIERYVDENGQLVQKSRDMIWNYHCWVENWMTRPDLKPGFDGWQVMDPTPQEKSEGVYCCGPIPLKAIKEGELTYKYDAPFVFAEVNADVHTFMKRKDGSTKNIISSVNVGLKISTKSVGSDRREDITHLYKYPEGRELRYDTTVTCYQDTPMSHYTTICRQDTSSLLGYDATGLAHLYLGSFSHSSLQILSNSVRMEGKRCCTAIFRSLQRCSIGFKSRIWLATQGHSETCPEATPALSWLCA